MLNGIERNVYNRIEELQALTRGFPLQRILNFSNEEFEALANIQNNIEKAEEIWRSTSEDQTTLFMRELMDNELSRNLREKMAFYEQRYRYRVYGEIFVTNKYGANAAQSGKTSDYYQADELWWQEAKKDGLFVQDIAYDESAKVYSLDVSIKIDDPQGNFLGVMKAVLNVEEVIDILQNYESASKERLGRSVFRLVNKDGGIIYSTGPFNIYDKIPSGLWDVVKGHDQKYHIVTHNGNSKNKILSVY